MIEQRNHLTLIPAFMDCSWLPLPFKVLFSFKWILVGGWCLGTWALPSPPSFSLLKTVCQQFHYNVTITALRRLSVIKDALS